MKTHPAFRSTKRVCVICGKALRKTSGGTETTYGYHTMLQMLGYPWPADKAHPSCVREKMLEKQRIMPS